MANLNPSTVGELTTFWDPDEMDVEEFWKNWRKKEKKDKEER